MIHLNRPGYAHLRPTMVACLGLILVLASCKEKTDTSPRHKDIVDAVFASGNIMTKDQYKVIANADGYLEHAYVSEGDTVNRDALLFRLAGQVQQTQVQNAKDNYRYALTNAAPQSPQVEQLGLQIRQAREKYEVDSTNYRRYERLLPTRAVAQVDYDNARLNMQASSNNLAVLEKNLADLQHTLTLNTDNARAQLKIQSQNNDYFLLAAVAPGVVMNVYKRKGELVRKGDVVADLSAGKIYAKLLIAEDDIGKVQLNQTVLIALNTDKDTVYKASVTKIYPSFDDSDQSFVAEAFFTGGVPAALKDGTQLQANIVIGEHKNALVIPTIYLENGDKVVLKDGHKEVPVRTGIRNLDYTEILDGLSENQIIVLPKRN